MISPEVLLTIQTHDLSKPHPSCFETVLISKTYELSEIAPVWYRPLRRHGDQPIQRFQSPRTAKTVRSLQLVLVGRSDSQLQSGAFRELKTGNGISR
jgi:hypothetical protein